ncbi:hypothetical protein WJX81_005074 [Elliptochloris bilobata]|uniref:ARID domain-containing protein n=1 Tax=Elliptochloris bilobata TaxID=381761 RepID=A0AAW1PZK2_9CHLO
MGNERPYAHPVSAIAADIGDALLVAPDDSAVMFYEAEVLSTAGAAALRKQLAATHQQVVEAQAATGNSGLEHCNAWDNGAYYTQIRDQRRARHALLQQGKAQRQAQAQGQAGPAAEQALAPGLRLAQAAAMAASQALILELRQPVDGHAAAPRAGAPAAASLLLPSAAAQAPRNPRAVDRCRAGGEGAELLEAGGSVVASSITSSSTALAHMVLQRELAANLDVTMATRIEQGAASYNGAAAVASQLEKQRALLLVATQSMQPASADAVAAMALECPAAFHFTCAGYADENDIPGAPDDAWLCWSCAAGAERPFAHPVSAIAAEIGDELLVAPDDSATMFYEAEVLSARPDDVEVLFLAFDGPARWLPRDSRRIWHGTRDRAAWEVRGAAYLPNSRLYAVDARRIASAAAAQARLQVAAPAGAKQGVDAGAAAGAPSGEGPSSAGADAAPDVAPYVQESEVTFMRALMDWHEKNASTYVQPKMYQKAISPYKLWHTVMAYGGYDMVAEGKMWATVARTLGAPDSMTDKSFKFKRMYTETLAQFERDSRAGKTGVAVPSVTKDVVPAAPGGGGAAPRKRPRVGGLGPVGRPFRAAPDRPVVGPDVEVRLREAGYLGGWVRGRVLQAVRGSRYEGGWRFQVELEPAPKAGAASASAVPAPGANPVTGLSSEPPASGGVAANGTDPTPQPEGNSGNEFLRETVSDPGNGRERDWAPLLYAPAAGEAPAVALRRPLNPVSPPAPDRKWEPGERAEGFWAQGGSWWPGTVQALRTDGAVVLKVDPTPNYPQGEEWELPQDHLRAAHPAEKSGYGLIEPVQDGDWVMASAWRARLGWRQHEAPGEVGGAVEAYTAAALLPAPFARPAAPRMERASRGAPGRLTALEGAAARMLGAPSIQDATPRAESAAESLLGLAPHSPRAPSVDLNPNPNPSPDMQPGERGGAGAGVAARASGRGPGDGRAVPLAPIAQVPAAVQLQPTASADAEMAAQMAELELVMAQLRAQSAGGGPASR